MMADATGTTGSTRKVRVLIIDDSALVRNALAAGLSADPGIEVVGTASNPLIARDKILQLRPDVLTLDVEMPKMDGIEFLRRLMPQHPLPVIMVSALTERGKRITLQALEAGAVDFVAKPRADIARGLEAMQSELRAKVKAASRANVARWRSRPAAAPARGPLQCQALAETTDKVIVIGASAGGTEALCEVIPRLPAEAPGTVVVQHMPPGFTRLFAERLDGLSAVRVKEAETGDRIRPGWAFIAPGGLQTTLVRSGGFYHLECRPGPLVCGHCPSVQVLMDSAAQQVGPNAVGVMLTGMGHDGADGLLAMRRAGARTLSQDEATSTVFGMPKVAWERGGAERQVPLDEVTEAILEALMTFSR